MFVRIAESGAFSKAADAMRVPRATASKLIQDLEAHLGVQLFQRTTRRVNMTPEGAQYLERASKLLAELQDMDESVAGTKARPQGRLRVEVGSLLANLLLIPALREFQARYPLLQLDLGINDRNLDLVGEGVDCAIRGGAMPDTSMVARRLADLELVTCAAPAYVERRGMPKHPRELASGHTLVGYFSSLTGKRMQLRFERGDEKLSIPVVGGVAMNESTAHVNALVAGVGIGQTFRFVVASHVERGTLLQLLPQWRLPSMRVSLVYPNSRNVSIKVRAFSDWAATLFAAVDSRSP